MYFISNYLYTKTKRLFFSSLLSNGLEIVDLSRDIPIFVQKFELKGIKNFVWSGNSPHFILINDKSVQLFELESYFNIKWSIKRSFIIGKEIIHMEALEFNFPLILFKSDSDINLAFIYNISSDSLIEIKLNSIKSSDILFTLSPTSRFLTSYEHTSDSFQNPQKCLKIYDLSNFASLKENFISKVMDVSCEKIFFEKDFPISLRWEPIRSLSAEEEFFFQVESDSSISIFSVSSYVCETENILAKATNAALAVVNAKGDQKLLKNHDKDHNFNSQTAKDIPVHKPKINRLRKINIWDIPIIKEFIKFEDRDNLLSQISFDWVVAKQIENQCSSVNLQMVFQSSHFSKNKAKNSIIFSSFIINMEYDEKEIDATQHSENEPKKLFEPLIPPIIIPKYSQFFCSQCVEPEELSKKSELSLFSELPFNTLKKCIFFMDLVNSSNLFVFLKNVLDSQEYFNQLLVQKFTLSSFSDIDRSFNGTILPSIHFICNEFNESVSSTALSKSQESIDNIYAQTNLIPENGVFLEKVTKITSHLNNSYHREISYNIEENSTLDLDNDPINLFIASKLNSSLLYSLNYSSFVSFSSVFNKLSMNYPGSMVIEFITTLEPGSSSNKTKNNLQRNCFLVVLYSLRMRSSSITLTSQNKTQYFLSIFKKTNIFFPEKYFSPEQDSYMVPKRSEGNQFFISIEVKTPHGLGLILESVDVDQTEIVIVKGFKRNPKDGSLLPVEHTGKVQIGDQLLEVNGFHLINRSLQDVIQHINTALSEFPNEKSTISFILKFMREDNKREKLNNIIDKTLILEPQLGVWEEFGEYIRLPDECLSSNFIQLDHSAVLVSTIEQIEERTSNSFYLLKVLKNSSHKSEPNDEFSINFQKLAQREITALVRSSNYLKTSISKLPKIDDIDNFYFPNFTWNMLISSSNSDLRIISLPFLVNFSQQEKIDFSINQKMSFYNLFPQSVQNYRFTCSDNLITLRHSENKFNFLTNLNSQLVYCEVSQNKLRAHRFSLCMNSMEEISVDYLEAIKNKSNDYYLVSIRNNSSVLSKGLLLFDCSIFVSLNEDFRYLPFDLLKKNENIFKGTSRIVPSNSAKSLISASNHPMYALYCLFSHYFDSSVKDIITKVNTMFEKFLDFDGRVISLEDSAPLLTKILNSNCTTLINDLNSHIEIGNLIFSFFSVQFSIAISESIRIFRYLVEKLDEISKYSKLAWISSMDQYGFRFLLGLIIQDRVNAQKFSPLNGCSNNNNQNMQLGENQICISLLPHLANLSDQKTVLEGLINLMIDKESNPIEFNLSFARASKYNSSSIGQNDINLSDLDITKYLQSIFKGQLESHLESPLQFLSKISAIFWIHDLNPLTNFIYQQALNIFKQNKSVMEIFLELVLVRRIDILFQLSKADKSASGKQLMSFLTILNDDFQSESNRIKIKKNAFALIRKQQYKQAVAIFLLADPPMIKEAASVLYKQHNDLHLAILCTRIAESNQLKSQKNPEIIFHGALLQKYTRNIYKNELIPDLINYLRSLSASPIFKSSKLIESPHCGIRGIDSFCLCLHSCLWIQDIAILRYSLNNILVDKIFIYLIYDTIDTHSKNYFNSNSIPSLSHLESSPVSPKSDRSEEIRHLVKAQFIELNKLISLISYFLQLAVLADIDYFADSPSYFDQMLLSLDTFFDFIGVQSLTTEISKISTSKKALLDKLRQGNFFIYASSLYENSEKSSSINISSQERLDVPPNNDIPDISNILQPKTINPVEKRAFSSSLFNFAASKPSRDTPSSIKTTESMSPEPSIPNALDIFDSLPSSRHSRPNVNQLNQTKFNGPVMSNHVEKPTSSSSSNSVFNFSSSRPTHVKESGKESISSISEPLVPSALDIFDPLPIQRKRNTPK